MVAFTLKNIPDYIHKYFKEQAKAHHRSLNREILFYLEKAPGRKPSNVEEEIRQAKEFHKKVKGFLTQEELSKMKNRGRP